MAIATGSRRIIHTCALCSNRWNPRYVSTPGCPYCHVPGRVVLKPSVAEQDRQKKARKARLRMWLEATYTVPDGRFPAWNVFWAFVYHDTHAQGILEVDLAYCVAHSILERKCTGTDLGPKVMGVIGSW